MTSRGKQCSWCHSDIYVIYVWVSSKNRKEPIPNHYWCNGCSKIITHQFVEKSKAEVRRCIVCKRHFQPAREKGQKVCSKDCQYKLSHRRAVKRKKELSKPCVVCGTMIIPQKPSRPPSCCSRECRYAKIKQDNLRRRQEHSYPCEICGEIIIPKRLGKTNQRRTCSENCQRKLQSEVHKKPTSPTKERSP